MSGTYTCCQKCGRLYIDSNLKECVEKQEDGSLCGGELKKGLENLTFSAKQQIAEHERKINNANVRRQYELKPKKGFR